MTNSGDKVSFGDTVHPSWRLDHVGHAVKDMKTAVAYYQNSFGFEVECEEELQTECLKIVFLKLANTTLELLAPLPGNTNIQKFLDKRGEGMHHVCFEVPSVAAELERLSKQGLELIDTVPRAGSRGRMIAFVHPKSTHGVLLELCSKV